MCMRRPKVDVSCPILFSTLLFIYLEGEGQGSHYIALVGLDLTMQNPAGLEL